MSEEKENRYRALAMVSLIILILSLSIFYLAVSKVIKTKSNISGMSDIIDDDVKINDYRWNIYFDNLRTVRHNDAKIDKYPTLDRKRSYIGNFEVTLTKPGDKVIFYYDIINNGNIDAKYDKTYINGIYKTKDNEDKIYRSIYTISDWDGDGVTTYNEIKKSSENIKIVDNSYKNIINKGDKKAANLQIVFEGNEIPKGIVKLSINIKYNYKQK